MIAEALPISYEPANYLEGGQGFLVIDDLAPKKVGEMVIWALKNWLFGDF